MTIIESSSETLMTDSSAVKTRPRSASVGRAHHVAVPGDGHRRDARAGDDREDAREPVVVHAREAEHRQPEAGHAAREEQLQLHAVLEAGNQERADHHAERHEDEHERRRRGGELLEDLHLVGEGKRADQVLLHVVDADRDDRAAAEDRQPDRDEQATQLPVRAEEAERLDDVLADEREIQGALLLGRGLGRAATLMVYDHRPPRRGT